MTPNFWQLATTSNCQNPIISIFVPPPLENSTTRITIPHIVKTQRKVLKLSQLTIFFQVFKITTDAIAPLERDFLLKLGCVENLAVSKLTMQSLSHLLTQISNIGEMINLLKLIFFVK